MPSKPNLFIIGAMKSGTTSLHNYLDAHPKIAMSEEKEPGYFVEQLGLHKGEQWYCNLFEDETRYRYRGESSTHYTKLPVYRGVVERIFQFNPDARLIYIMRDPFERLISHYWHAVRDIHHGGETRPLLKAVAEQPDYLAFSDYATQLKPYIDLFGRNAVYALTFESLRQNPDKEVNLIFDWLQLENHPIHKEASTAHNQKPDDITGVSGKGILNKIQYSKTWDSISRFVPTQFKQLAKKAAYKEVDQQEIERDILELRSRIAETQQKQIEALSHLLNRQFPEWR